MVGEHVFALDLPGHGESPGEGERRIEAYVARVIAWMDGLGIRQGVLVGHSMGGAIALTMALEFAPRLAALVLVGTGGRLRVNPSLLEATADEKTYPRAVDLVMRWAFSPQAPKRLVTLAHKRMAQVPHHVVHGDFGACDAYDVLDRLKDIEVPTLVICGREDKLTPLKYSRHLAEVIPDARIEVIDSAGHMAMLERPVEVQRAVKAFMDSVFESGTSPKGV